MPVPLGSSWRGVGGVGVGWGGGGWLGVLATQRRGFRVVLANGAKRRGKTGET